MSSKGGVQNRRACSRLQVTQRRKPFAGSILPVQRVVLLNLALAQPFPNHRFADASPFRVGTVGQMLGDINQRDNSRLPGSRYLPGNPEQETGAARVVTAPVIYRGTCFRF